MTTRVLAGLALLAAFCPAATAQYATNSYGSQPTNQAYGYRSSTDNCPHKVWLSAEYLYWKLKDAPQTFPLVTTAPPDTTTFGELGASDTTVVLGGNDLELEWAHGVRLSGGIRLDHDGHCSLEGSLFALEKTGFASLLGSDATGTPALFRPFILPDGTQASTTISFPGFASGSLYTSASSHLYGAEINLATAIYCGDCCRLELLTGVRYLDLKENLDFVQTRTEIGGGINTFGGIPLGVGSVIQRVDQFETDNNIYAPQIGVRWTYQSGPFAVGLTGKVGFGWNDRSVSINGRSTARTVDGTTFSAPGGLLALPSNRGTYSDTDFVIVPEIGATVGVNVFPWLRLTGGYNLLYVNKVTRPGDHLDPTINTSLIPTRTGPDVGGGRPVFITNESDFWAHGVTAGVMLRW